MEVGGRGLVKIATGVTTDGREVLGFAVGDSEDDLRAAGTEALASHANMPPPRAGPPDAPHDR